MDPMHGTVGVAPPNLEARSSLVPDLHGGNMDTPEMRVGVTCYLGVNVPGALFSLGDGHARQGEGETCGVAVACAMNTVVIVDVLKPVSVAPAGVGTHIMSVGSARPLEDAFGSPRPHPVGARRLRPRCWTPTSCCTGRSSPANV
jgi:acetamidase/formamidase